MDSLVVFYGSPKKLNTSTVNLPTYAKGEFDAGYDVDIRCR